MCVYVHMHNVFASNELISVTVLSLYKGSPFTLSLLILLSERKRTFSQTITTLSVSILHIHFPFLHSLVPFHFYIQQMSSSQISQHPIQVIPCTKKKKRTRYNVWLFADHTLFPPECLWNSSQCLQKQSISAAMWPFQHLFSLAKKKKEN